MKFHEFSWKCASFREHLYINFLDFVRQFVNFNEISLILMNVHENSWMFMKFVNVHEFSWKFMYFPELSWTFVNCHAFSWNILMFPGDSCKFNYFHDNSGQFTNFSENKLYRIFIGISSTVGHIFLSKRRLNCGFVRSGMIQNDATNNS